MSNGGLPESVKSFIAGHIDSAVQLELLLLMYQSQGRLWDAAAICAELKIDASWAASQLAYLGEKGLLRGNEAASPVYEYAPRTEELAAAVAELANVYADRRVSVISLIYSRPTDNLRAFADAFRLRKERPDG